MTQITARLTNRRDTSANWTAANPVISAGEIVYTTDVFYSGTDQMKFKVGDGVQTWSQLDYMPIGTGSSLTFSNGLTLTGSNITLGGTLTANTTITGAFDFEIDAGAGATKTIFFLESNVGFQLLANNGGDGHQYSPFLGLYTISSGTYTVNAPTVEVQGVINATSLHAKGTAGNGHLGLKHQTANASAAASESVLFADVNGDIKWKNDNLFYSTFKTSANTADRIYTFPNVSGTVITTGDIGTVTNTMLAGSIDLTTKVTGILPGANGGTGVNNGTNLITVAGNLTTTGAFNTTFSQQLSATYTLPRAAGTIPLSSDFGYNVKDYGLVGDGVTNDRAALNTLLNTTAPTGSTIYFPPGTYIIDTTGISVSGKRFSLIGNGATIKTTTNMTILSIATSATDNGSHWTIKGFRFEGNSTGSSQIALAFGANTGGFKVVDCDFTAFGGKCLTVTNTINSAGTKFLGGMVSNCNFFDFVNGIDLTSRAEYLQITDSNFYNWTATAINSTSGNMVVDGCNINYGVDGILIRTGTNSAHGIISNCNINHNSNFGLSIWDSTDGMTIENCHIYQSYIYLKNMTGVTFRGGVIDSLGYFFENTVATQFVGVNFASSYANTVNNNYNSTTSQTKYVNCYHNDGRYASDPASFSTVRLYATAANTTATVAKNAEIKRITIVNTTANAVTGGIKIGTTSGGTEVVVAQAVGANELVVIADASILKRLFSTTASTTLYIQAVTSWNSASLNIYIEYTSPLY